MQARLQVQRYFGASPDTLPVPQLPALSGVLSSGANAQGASMHTPESSIIFVNIVRKTLVVPSRPHPTPP